MIDQLANDTAAIKASEECRKERLDTALTEVEAVVTELKNASRRRDDDTRRIAEEVHGLQAMIPKALKGQEENTDTRLKELTIELKSLKTLVANRMAPPPATPASAPQRPMNAGANMFGPLGTANVVGGGSIANPTINPAQPMESPAAGVEKSTTAAPLSRFGTGRAGIPAWQLAASKKAEEEKAEKRDSGIMSEVDGTGAA